MLRDIVEEHAEEAAFLWLLRDQALGSPHYTLEDLAELEERIEAHVDGLRIAETIGWDAALGQLTNEGSGETFVAAILALESGNRRQHQVVADHVVAASESARGLIAAIGWVPQECALACLGDLLGSADPVLRSVGIAGSVAHGKDPGIALQMAFESESAELRRRALAAAGRLHRSDLLGQLSVGLSDPELACRFWAAWSLVLLGDSKGLLALQRIAEEGGPHSERAAVMASRIFESPRALAWQRSLTKDPGAARVSVLAAAGIGDPTLVSWLIEQMAVPEVARLAGEALTMVTGVDLIAIGAAGEPPPGFVAGPSDIPDDEDVSVDPDEDLVWPNVTAVSAWWHEHQGRLSKGVRYLTGKPISAAAVRETLRYGNQRQRVAAAIEGSRFGTRALFETRAPARLQLLRLGLTGDPLGWVTPQS